MTEIKPGHNRNTNNQEDHISEDFYYSPEQVLPNNPDLINEPHGIVSDEKKRLFLRLAGLAGISVLFAAILPKRAEALVLGSSPTTGVIGVKNSSNVRINPATQETLASIKTQTDLLTFDAGSNPANLKVNVAAGDVGVLNVANTAINPATEDTLALIKTNSDKFIFSGENLKVTSTGDIAGTVALKDTADTEINPATEDSLILLRRILRQVDSLGVVDSAQRQKVTIDSFTAALALPTVTTVTTVATVTSATNLVALGGVDGRFLHIDTARNASANGIRGNLIFS